MVGIDLDLIVGSDWDQGNARKSFDRHGVTNAEAALIFDVLDGSTTEWAVLMPLIAASPC